MNFLSRQPAHGHSAEMKDLAASYVIEIWLEHLPIKNDEELYTLWEKARSLMDRGPKRRAFPSAVIVEGLRVMRSILGQNPPK